ncbi:MAG: hypothetical protein AAGA90_24100 [Actinomycetota bacterium]
MPTYNPTGSTCSGGPATGTIALRDAILEAFRVTEFGDHRDVAPTFMGIYNCRPPRGQSSGLSEHGEGRAVDIGLNAFDAEDLAVGDQIAEAMVTHADALGIQSVIWNRRVWGYGRWFWRSYGGVNPHTDHLHIGQNWAGATTLTADQALDLLGDHMSPELEAAIYAIRDAVAPEDFRQPDGAAHNLAFAALQTNGVLNGTENHNLVPQVRAIYKAIVEDSDEFAAGIANAVANALEKSASSAPAGATTMTPKAQGEFIARVVLQHLSRGFNLAAAEA